MSVDERRERSRKLRGRGETLLAIGPQATVDDGCERHGHVRRDFRERRALALQDGSERLRHRAAVERELSAQ